MKTRSILVQGWHVGSLLLSAAMLAPSASAALINLTSYTSFGATTNPGGVATTVNVPISTYVGPDSLTHVGAVVNGALIVPSANLSGSGVYRRLYEIDQSFDVGDAYNRVIPKGASPDDFEDKIPNGFDPFIRISDLADQGGYYAFSLDLNDPSSFPDGFESVDEIKLFIGNVDVNGNPVDPTPLPGSVAGLSSLGTMVYDLQQGLSGSARNSILLDYDTGSGRDEMTILFPKSIFDGFNINSYVYLYSKLGELGTSQTQQSYVFNGFQITNGGYDEWAARTTTTPTTSSVPELTSVIPLAVLLIGGSVFGRRRTGIWDTAAPPIGC